MGTPQGVLLAGVVCGGAALLTLILVVLWPKENDALQTGSEKLLRRWRRFAGIDD